MNPELDNQTPVGAGPAPTPTSSQNPPLAAEPTPAPAPTPAPVAEPAPTPAPNLTSTSEPTPVAPPSMQATGLPEKKKNKTTLILVIVLVLILVGCGVAAAIMLMPKGGNNAGGSSSSNGGSTPTTPVIPVEPVASEEVELTDQTIITDIKAKLSTAMITSFKGDYASTYSILQQDKVLLKEGTISDAEKALSILVKFNGDSLTEAQKQSILDTDEEYFTKNPRFEESTLSKEDFGDMTMAYDAAAVREEYKKIYGEELAKEVIDVTDIFSCGYYGYNAEYDIYFYEAGCGGIGDPRAYYISKYTKDDTNAYVYLSAGTVIDEENSYCDVAYFNETDSLELCTNESSEQLIDSSNYTNYAQYKITFAQGTDGNYYLEKAESL